MENYADWSELMALQKGAKLVSICSHMIQVREDLYRVGPSIYCVVDDFEVSHEDLSVISLMWAGDDGAALRAYFNDIEADSHLRGTPPPQLLPLDSLGGYESILAGVEGEKPGSAIEYASYRIMTDGVFVHKGIESGQAVYYFRSQGMDTAEVPYAILWKMKAV
jgi:hypothetical protein